MTTKAVIYTRFSPRRNAGECESCETQVDLCRVYCAQNGLEVIGEHRDEALSGKRADNRPGLQTAMDQACHRNTALVVYSLSRLARSLRDAIDIADRLEKARADLVSLRERIDTTTPMGRMLFHVCGALNQFDREIKAEITSHAMRRHQTNGRRMSDRTPYGWQRDPDDPALLIEDPTEQAVIRRIVEMRQRGKGYREICRTLEGDGVSCRDSYQWHHTTVKSVLKRAGVK